MVEVKMAELKKDLSLSDGEFKISRTVIQFFTRGDVALALCSDGTVFSFRENFKDGKEIVEWRRQEKYENPK